MGLAQAKVLCACVCKRAVGASTWWAISVRLECRLESVALVEQGANHQRFGMGE